MIAFSFGPRPIKSSSKSSLVFGTEKVNGISSFLSSEFSGFSVVVVAAANFFDFLDVFGFFEAISVSSSDPDSSRSVFVKLIKSLF